MANRVVALIIVAGLALALYSLIRGVTYQEEPPPLADEYVERTQDDLGAANVVTGVIVTFRGLDTLGEVTVLFAATAGVGFVVTRRRRDAEQAVPEGDDTDSNAAIRSPVSLAGSQEASEILSTASRLLSPILLVFGTYIFVHGHLTPGGGFQGGVVIATAIVLAILGDNRQTLPHGLMTTVESLSGITYVALGILGLVLAAGFLDPTFLGLGEFGSIVSAGAIPLIYAVIGLKVGTELAGMIDRLRAREEG
jgi:multicomponent Na+:H+ antiporter subunit B